MRSKASGWAFTAPRGAETLSRRGFLRAAGGTALAASVGGLGLLPPRRAAAAATLRPLSDVLNAQGMVPSQSIGPPLPPLPAFLIWGQKAPSDRSGAIDYAGLATPFLASEGISLGTSVTGTITERPLADGRAEVTVLLHTTNTMAFAVADPVFAPTLFGFVPEEIAADPVHNRPGVGESFAQFVFDNTAPGAPLPDVLVALFAPAFGPAPPGFEGVIASFRGTARGPLRAAFGVPEGTPGELVISQTGLLATSGIANPGSRVAFDAFPAELVDLHAIG